MEKHIKEQYNDDILHEILRRFSIHRETVHPLQGFESFIYEFEKNGEPYILRVSHSSRRTPDMVNGEIEWLHYMSDNGIPAARPVPSEQGRFVEEAEAADGSYFTAVAFERAPGRPPIEDDWNRNLIQLIGRTLGRMHLLTKQFRPSKPAYKRPEWHEEIAGTAERHLPSSEAGVARKFHELNQYLHTFPKERDAYGLVHFDFHRGNFFVHNGNITLFDFDDCQYSWFAYDIAISLFYALPLRIDSQKKKDTANRLYTNLMEGYSRENTLDTKWLEEIPTFLKHREIDLYTVIHRSLDVNNLQGWVKDFMANRKYRIEHDVPYVDMNFS